MSPKLPVALNEYGAIDFVTAPASDENAVRLFDPTWVCQIPVAGLKSGRMRLFSDADPRPTHVVETFGDITNWKVLELGSFEGAHAYQLERFGANPVIGIEANPYIFLRSLVVKNMLGMKTKFMLGDFLGFLQQDTDYYDLIFSSGVLYHMQDPVELLYQIAKRTERVLLWTHYVTDEMASKWSPSKVTKYEKEGFSCDYFRYEYNPQRDSRSYGGVATFCSRIRKAAITQALEAFGFSQFKVAKENLDHPGGPAITLLAWK